VTTPSKRNIDCKIAREKDASTCD